MLSEREESDGSGEVQQLVAAKPKPKIYRKKVETSWSHENILKLIQEVESRRSLWDIGCPEYKTHKDFVWQEVADSISATLNDCKAKGINLRTTFNCNVNKLQKKKSGQGTDELVSITWKYFKPMMFLESNKIRQSTQSTSSMQPECSAANESFVSDFEFSDDVPKLSPIQQQRKRAKTLVSPPSKSNDLKEMAVQALQSMCTTQSQPRDSFAALGEYIACELRSLTTEQAMCAKTKLICTFNQIIEEAILFTPQRSVSENDSIS